MPIMAAHSRSDARGAARLLAHMALESLSSPRLGEREEVALNNMYRLMLSVRSDIFSGREAAATASSASWEKLTLRTPMERNVAEVKRALDSATTVAFGELAKKDAIQVVEGVLRWIAYPRTANRPNTDDVNRTELFLRELVNQL